MSSTPASTRPASDPSKVAPSAAERAPTDTRPPAPSNARGRGHRIITIAATLVILAALKYGEPFLVPVVSGVVIAAVSSPLVTWLVRRGAPPVLGAALVLVLDVAALGGTARLLLLAASDLQDSLPHYVAELGAASRAAQNYLQSHGLHAVADATLKQTEQVGALLQGMVGDFANAASHVAVVIFVVFFALCEAGVMGDKLRALNPNAEAQFERVDHIVHKVQLYLAVKLWTSLLAGTAAFIVLKVVGVNLALLLALLLFVLHFIPNLGTALATVPAVLLALADRGAAAAATVGVAYVTINTLIGNLIEPRMLGTRLGVSPFVVLIGMLFWGFLWGPVGALLAVPLLVAGKIVLEDIPDLAWIGALASNEALTQPPSRRLSARARARLGLDSAAHKHGSPREYEREHGTARGHDSHADNEQHGAGA